MNKPKPVSLATCGILVGGLALAGSAFSMQPMSQGYLLAASAATEKAAEGSCGMAKADADKDGKISRAEFTTMHPDQPAKFDSIDSNKDGVIDDAEAKAHHAEKAKAEKSADAKGHAEGKCGGKM